jgi:threonyl-tRNA synthetase
VTDKPPKQPETMRHSLAHIMAAAIQKLWPEVKFGVGPTIENGFYYDVDLGKKKLSEDDFEKIEKEMRQIVKANYPFEKSEMPIDLAIEWAKKGDQPYKSELLNDLKQTGTTNVKDIEAAELGLSGEGNKIDAVTFYKIGSFTDLCLGPHLESTGKVGAFKLTKVAGAYWRGKEENPQMQRLYGVAFSSQKGLDDYLTRVEEAKKRDHRKLGQELDLFVFSDLVGSGLPLYTPRGTVLIEELKKVLRDISQEHDMQLVSIPHLAKIDLYKMSGHAEKFADELFHVKSHYDQEFVLKPVNCPHHTQIYASRQRSYRDLPLRYIEQTMQYRDEKPGQLGGLQRCRGFTVDDGHTFCRVDQIEQEVSTLVEIIQQFYESVGLWGNHWVSLSVRDSSVPERYIGEPADWNEAEKMLEQVAGEYKLGAKKMVGEAAIYGPKLDFMFKDALGRETQLATIQLDFAMPKRFSLTYIDQNSQEVTPVMIHRAILGSFERFIMLLIEHFAGKFPVWLSPEQIRFITVNQTDEIVKFAQKLVADAKDLGLRSYVDSSNETVSKKIREAEGLKVPYVIVIGEKELKTGETTPRVRSDLVVQEPKPIKLNNFLNTVANEAKSRTTHTTM